MFDKTNQPTPLPAHLLALFEREGYRETSVADCRRKGGPSTRTQTAAVASGLRVLVPMLLTRNAVSEFAVIITSCSALLPRDRMTSNSYVPQA